MLDFKCIKFISGGAIKRKIIKRKESSLYLIFPENSGELAYYGLLYADEYMNEIYAKKIVVVTEDAVIKNAAEFMIRSEKKIVLLEKTDMENLLFRLSYSVDMMGESVVKNLIYISDKYPYGSGLSLLYKKNIFEQSYFVWNRIYHKSNVYIAKAPQTVPITYCGDGKQLAEFMKVGEAK